MTEITLSSTYPSHMVRCWRLADGTVITIRPVRPDDGPLEQEFVRTLSPRSRYYRFFNGIRELSPDRLERLIHVDYRRQMTLLAVYATSGGERQAGVAEYVAEDGSDHCEFAVVVHDAWQRRGLGTLLVERLARAALRAGYTRMEGEVMADNYAMLELARSLGFGVRRNPEDARFSFVRRTLAQAGGAAGSRYVQRVACAG